MRLKKSKGKAQVKEKEKVEFNGVTLTSTNNNGIFQTEKNAKGKDVDTLVWENCRIIHDRIGVTISEDIRPKFAGWTYMDYLEQFHKDKTVRWIEPMGSFEDKDYLGYEENNPREFAELKRDGHRALMYMHEEHNRFFSRNVSTKTDWWGENSDQIPHLRDLNLPEYAGTVLDGEVDYGTDSMHVQSVMGALPANAIQYQFKNGFISFFAFDILYYKGINVQKMPQWKRKIYLAEVINAFHRKYESCHMEFAKMYLHKEAAETIYKLWHEYIPEHYILDMLDENTSAVSTYQAKFLEKVEEGYEGLIIKNMYATYEQGKKNREYWIKLKKQSTWDVIITGINPPTKEYSGKELANWKYWEIQGELVQINGQANAVEYADTAGEVAIPVTKPYFMGWLGAIRFGVVKLETWEQWNEVCGGDTYGEVYFDQLKDEGLVLNADMDTIQYIQEVGDCKGLSEELQEDLKHNWEKYVKEHRVFEVLANGLIDKEIGSLRHPRFFRWRDDKNWWQCDWHSHIREEKPE